MSHDQELLEWTKAKLSSRFKMKHLGVENIFEEPLFVSRMMV